MNFFEGELRKLLGDSDVISDPSFAGRACLGTLGKDLRVRLEFVTTGMADHYNALKIKVLNRTEGEVDTLLLRFQDVWEKKPVPGNPNFRGGVSPHIWICDGKPEWYAWRPAPADRELLLQQVRQYLEPFRERMPERGHDGPKLVYICAPLRGDVANNIEFARQKAQEVFQSGDIPVCPPHYASLQRRSGLLCSGRGGTGDGPSPAGVLPSDQRLWFHDHRGDAGRNSPCSGPRHSGHLWAGTASACPAPQTDRSKRRS